MSITNTDYTNSVLLTSGAPANWLGNTQIVAHTFGTAKNDAIYGTAQAVSLAGGAGDDTYYIYGRETVVEAPGQGIDTIVAAWTNVTLPDNVENLTISQNYNGTGNALANIIIGDKNVQTLNGAGGDDVLTGGGGRDTFVFDAQSGHDVITDFVPGAGATVRLAGYSQFTTLGQLQAAMTQVGADTVLRLDAADSLTFRSVQKTSFTAGDFKLAIDPSKLTLTFADDFSTLSLWSSKSGGTWRTDYGYGTTSDSLGSRTLPTNGELEIYVDPTMKGKGTTALGLNPFTIQNGVLTITAAPTPAEDKNALYGYQYTSGLLTTKNSFAQEYGYFEIRAELPSGSGAWPAFWLLPAKGGWPPELDVMEAWGSNSVSQSSHTGAVNTSLTTTTTVAGATSDFHTYGMRWDASHIDWYVDGVMTGEIATPADMHQAMYLLIDLAVAPGTSATVLPAQLKVDYVHAYSLDSAPLTVSPPPASTPPPTPSVVSAPPVSSSAGVSSSSSATSTAAPDPSPQTPSGVVTPAAHPTTTVPSSSSASSGAAHDLPAKTPSAVNTPAVDPDAIAPSSSATPGAAADLKTAVLNVMRVSEAQFKAAAAATSAPTASAFDASLAAAVKLAIGAAAGSTDPSVAQAQLLASVQGTVSVANLSYAFFTGLTPTAAGLDYLVHSSANPNDLNDHYFSSFNTTNRYINFAVSLATGAGAGAAAFQATFGSESLTQAAADIYQRVFGLAAASEKLSQILNAEVSDGTGGTETRAAYLSHLAGSTPDGIGVKAALAGWLLAESQNEQLGPYYIAEQNFLSAMAHGDASYNVDLLATYAHGAPLVGQAQIDPTLV